MQRSTAEGTRGQGKSLSCWKELWHPIFKLIYQCKAKIDSVSLLSRELSRRDVSKCPHFDLAQWINTTLYCFNLRAIDFSMLTPYRGTFIIKQAYSMIKAATAGSYLLIFWSDHMTVEQLVCRLAQIVTLQPPVVVPAATLSSNVVYYTCSRV